MQERDPEASPASGFVTLELVRLLATATVELDRRINDHRRCVSWANHGPASEPRMPSLPWRRCSSGEPRATAYRCTPQTQDRRCTCGYSFAAAGNPQSLAPMPVLPPCTLDDV